MPAASVMDQPAKTPHPKLWTFGNVLLMTLTVGGWIGGMFVAAGTLNWLRGWICIVVLFPTYAIAAILVRLKNRELLAARANWSGWEMRPFDRIFIMLMFPLYLAQPIVAGLDAVRFHWSSMPFATVYVGLALLAFGMMLVTWAMMVNPFAEAIVRIQSERGHVAVNTGPYRFVRHPMYVGAILMFLATALILGSLWAVAIGILLAILFVWRTAREDSVLRRELLGYDDFAAVTRYRLLPGVW